MIPLKPAEEEPEDDAPKDATALQIEHDTLQEVMFYSSICDQHSSISWIQAMLWGKKEKKWSEIAKWWTGDEERLCRPFPFPDCLLASFACRSFFAFFP